MGLSVIEFNSKLCAGNVFQSVATLPVRLFNLKISQLLLTLSVTFCTLSTQTVLTHDLNHYVIPYWMSLEVISVGRSNFHGT